MSASGLKVLLSAYSCEPGRGSEPGVGWDWMRQIARYHDVWVITRANNRDAIERALAREPMPNVHWAYFDLPRYARFFKRGARGVALYYYLWQAGIYPLARRLERAHGFDLTHHVTFGKYWAPSFLGRLAPPFVWGPVGGGESAPASFWPSFGARGIVYEAARTAGRALEDADPFVRMTARRAALGLAKTTETARKLERLGCPAVKIYLEVSLAAEEIRTLAALPRHDAAPVRFLSTGRMLHWKGFYLGIEAFARAARELGEAEYVLVGDGPERRKLERLAARLGVAGQVAFRGVVPRAEALRELARSDVVAHPSLHDSSGWVTIEAMAAGRPVVCLDCGGPGAQVSADAGIKVPVDTPQGAIAGVAAAMVRLGRDAELRRRMGDAGRRRVAEHFRSDHRADLLAAIYDEVLARRRGELGHAAAPAAGARR